MRRREFIALLGGSAATWPLVARAQRSAPPVIGFLHAATSAGYASMTATFIEAVADWDYPNIMIEYRWAEGHLDRLPELAMDLVNCQVSLIFAGGVPDAVFAAKNASSTIPIVFANATDPVAIRACCQPRSTRRQRHGRHLPYQHARSQGVRGA